MLASFGNEKLIAWIAAKKDADESQQPQEKGQEYEALRGQIINITNQLSVLQKEMLQYIQENPINLKKMSLWRQLARNVNLEIKNVHQVIESEQKLNKSLIELQMKNANNIKEIGDMKIVKENLEKRLQDFQVKSERVDLLEQQVKSAQKQVQNFKLATETVSQELDIQKTKQKEQERENAELRNRILAL